MELPSLSLRPQTQYIAAMVRSTAIAAAVAALALQADAAGLYPKSSKVLQVDSTNYDRLITKSNYTSIVE